MCPNINNKCMKIGSFKLIKWKDGYKYKAEILRKGSKFFFIHAINLLLFIHFKSSNYYLLQPCIYELF